MSNIINNENAHNLIESTPSDNGIDLLSKDKLKVLASYLQLTVSNMTKSKLTQSVKSELFGIHGTEGGEHNGAAGEGFRNIMRFDEHLPEGFTPEQYLELARLNAAQANSQTQQDRASSGTNPARPSVSLMISAQNNANVPVIAPPPGLTMTSVIPPFTEDNVQDFFVLFEEVATGMGWTRHSWSFMLQTVLTGQARATYISVESEVRQD